jgi:hypothetical protein
MSEDTLKDLLPRVNELRKSLAHIYSMKQQNSASDDDIRSSLTSCALQITAFKRLSRKVYHLKNKHMQEVQVAKKKVEETSLRLQNLQYEKNQLLNEIRRCRDFRTKEMDNVDLMPLSAYYKEKGIKRPPPKDDDHKLHLERLAHELTVRKRLGAELEALQEKSKDVDNQTSSKLKFLSDLKSKLKNVEDATRPLQDFFGDQVTQLNESHENATHLPEPLYVLYRQLDSFAQTFGHTNSRGTGSTNKSITNKSRKASSSSSSSSPSSSSPNLSSFVGAYDQAESGIIVQLKIVPAVPFPNGNILEEIPSSSLGKRERIPSVYKDAVLVTLTSTADGGHMTIRFQYVPSVTKVTCIVVESSDNVPYNVLNELYCRDLSDNIVEEDIASYSANANECGASYLWTQWLAGLYRLSSGGNDDKSTPPGTQKNWKGRRVRPSTSSLLHTIMARRHRSVLLTQQINDFKKLINPVVVPPCVGAVCYPVHSAPQARLTSFDIVQENNDSTTGEDEKNDEIVPSSLMLHATFECKIFFSSISFCFFPYTFVVNYPENTKILSFP